MRRTAFAALTWSLLLLAAASAAVVQPAPGPQGPEDGAWRRQLWFIPLPGERLLMHSIVLRPPGEGPFPLVVINHGSIQSQMVRDKYPMREFPIASQWFLDRGYVVVLPLRPGHGETGGPYFEDQGECQNADFHQAGLRTADSIQAAIDYMTAQSFVQKSGVIVVGQSAGGWGALALASRNPRPVKAVINFAGGRGGRSDDKPNNNCSPDRLIAAEGEFGRATRIPTLWLYAENDSYFTPTLSKRMYEAFRNAGGDAEYHLLPPSGSEGHRLIDSQDGLALWAPIVETFLSRHR